MLLDGHVMQLTNSVSPFRSALASSQNSTLGKSAFSGTEATNKLSCRDVVTLRVVVRIEAPPSGDVLERQLLLRLTQRTPSPRSQGLRHHHCSNPHLPAIITPEKTKQLYLNDTKRGEVGLLSLTQLWLFACLLRDAYSSVRKPT